MNSDVCESALEPPSVFEFPFQPYPIQEEFMRKLFETLELKKLGVFESPTGTVSHQPNPFLTVQYKLPVTATNCQN